MPAGMQSDYSRPETAATTMTGRSSLYNRSSSDSMAYSVISNKFESTGEVLLLPKVNARRSIKFDKQLAGPKIMAVRETAQWLISNNSRVSDDLSKECRRLDDSYLKWYRKHFNEKKDVLAKVSNLLNYAKKEKHDRCRSYQSCYKNFSSTSQSRKSTLTMKTSPRHVTTHSRHGFFTTELPDIEQVDMNKGELETSSSTVGILVVETQEFAPRPDGTNMSPSAPKTPGVMGSPNVAENEPKTPANGAENGPKTPRLTSRTPGTKLTPASRQKAKTPELLETKLLDVPTKTPKRSPNSLTTPGSNYVKSPVINAKKTSAAKTPKEVRIVSPK